MDRSNQRQMAAPERLSLGTRFFHWATVTLLAIMYGLILAVWTIGPSETGGALVGLHRSVGLTLLLLVACRLLWRIGHPLPPLPAARWEKALAGSVQAGLYLCILAMPLLGWAASDSAGDTITLYGVLNVPSILPMDEDRSDALFQLHGQVAVLLLLLAALHIAGALRHRFVKCDGVFERML